MKKVVKGIILAGGNGSRLFPLTFGVSKQLLPIYDKPMIYYPLAILMKAKIRDILVITKPEDLNNYKNLLMDGSQLGLNIEYAIQENPNGIAEALIIGKKFIQNNDICLILGDNIFYGKEINRFLNNSLLNLEKGFSTIFGVKVKNPKDFGVVKFNLNKIESIVEKPVDPPSDISVAGIYFYKNIVCNLVNELKPSKRNELEISDLNNLLIIRNKLKLINISKHISWIDTGTYESMLSASNFFQELEKNEGLKYACIEQLALNGGYININQFKRLVKKLIHSDYGKYLENLIK